MTAVMPIRREIVERLTTANGTDAIIAEKPFSNAAAQFGRPLLYIHRKTTPGRVAAISGLCAEPIANSISVSRGR